MLERWVIRNLKEGKGGNRDDILKRIQKWREENHDTTIYAVQDTLLLEIGYDMLVLYDEINGKPIGIYTLEDMIRKQYGDDIYLYFFSKSNIGRRSASTMLKIKDFVIYNFEREKPEESRILLDKIDDYINSPENNYLKVSRNFISVNPYQLENLIYITKGMDPMYADFFKDNELAKKGSVLKSIKVVEHHLKEDPSYEFIFRLFLDGQEYSYRFELAPLRFSMDKNLYSSHNFIHRGGIAARSRANSIVEARMRHLYELEMMIFDESITKKEYYELFTDLFKGRKDSISGYDDKVNIWEEFEDGKIKKMKDDIIQDFVDRWWDAKHMSEDKWVERYYKKFYHEKYMPFIRRVQNYAEQNLRTGRTRSFYEWFLTVYLPSEIYPRV